MLHFFRILERELFLDAVAGLDDHCFAKASQVFDNNADNVKLCNEAENAMLIGKRLISLEKQSIPKESNVEFYVFFSIILILNRSI